MAEAIAGFASDKKAIEIVELDLRGVLGYADYFVDLHGQHGPAGEGDPRRHPRGDEAGARPAARAAWRDCRRRTGF